MIALSDIVILTISSALLVVALMRAYSPDNSLNAGDTTTEIRTQAGSQTPSETTAANQVTTTAATATTETTTSAAQTTPASTSRAVDVTSSVTQPTADPTTSTQANPAAAEVVFDTYTVQSGDSLSVIARRTGTSVQELQALNQLSGTVIQIGQNLRYPRP